MHTKPNFLSYLLLPFNQLFHLVKDAFLSHEDESMRHVLRLHNKTQTQALISLFCHYHHFVYPTVQTITLHSHVHFYPLTIFFTHISNLYLFLLHNYPFCFIQFQFHTSFNPNFFVRTQSCSTSIHVFINTQQIALFFTSVQF